VKPYDDLIVIAVALILAALALGGALLNLDPLFRLGLARKLERARGRTAVRILYAVVGLLLIAAAVMIFLRSR